MAKRKYTVIVSREIVQVGSVQVELEEFDLDNDDEYMAARQVVYQAIDEDKVYWEEDPTKVLSPFFIEEIDEAL